jgi:hypothetical protein
MCRLVGSGSGLKSRRQSRLAHALTPEFMTVKKRDVYIELSWKRLTVAVGSGSDVRFRSEPIELPEDPAGWISALGKLHSTLAELSRSVGVAPGERHRAAVLYTGPTQAVAIESLPVGSQGQAINAAKLSALESMSHATSNVRCEAIVLGRDARRISHRLSAIGDQPSADSRQPTADSRGPRRVHVAVAADRDEHLAAIEQLVTEAGMEFAWALPIDAPVMVRLVRQCLGDESPMVRLYMGEFSSLCFVSAGGSLLFARRIAIGIESFVAALTRPIRVRAGDEPVTLSEQESRHIVHTFGMPERDTVVHHVSGGPELRGVQIVPLLQPILQRIVVELRQSMRFSLAEDQLGPPCTVPLSCLGPGSRLPRLAEVIAMELDVPRAEEENVQTSKRPNVQTSKAARAFGFQLSAIGDQPKKFTVDGLRFCKTVNREPSTHNPQPTTVNRQPITECRAPLESLRDAMDDGKRLRCFGLVPALSAMKRQSAALRRWLWAGTAAAAVMVAVDAVRYSAAVDSLATKLEHMRAHHTELESFERTRGVLAGALQDMTRIERVLAEEVQHHFDGYAVLAELSRLTPEEVQLTEVTFRQSDGGMTGTIKGVAMYVGASGGGGGDEGKRRFTVEHTKNRQPSTVNRQPSADSREPRADRHPRSAAGHPSALRDYIESIRLSPLFTDAVLGNVQIEHGEGAGGVGGVGGPGW